jgi:type II secretory pathway pseudopilin PulG
MQPKFNHLLNKVHRPQLKRLAAAFSLLELLIAVAITALIFEAVFKGISNSLTLLNLTRENLRATQIMISRLEGLRLEAWGTNQLFNSSFVPTTFVDYYYPQGLNSSTNNFGTIYYGTMTIVSPVTFASVPARTPSSYSNMMALVTVTLTWTNNAPTYGQSSTYTRSMSTYVAQFGIQNYIIAN